jgi:hypothetical protein
MSLISLASGAMVIDKGSLRAVLPICDTGLRIWMTGDKPWFQLNYDSEPEKRDQDLKLLLPDKESHFCGNPANYCIYCRPFRCKYATNVSGLVHCTHNECEDPNNPMRGGRGASINPYADKPHWYR